MTDTAVADKVYIEPLTIEFASRIIHKERPDAILGTLGGQTGLNLVVELANAGVLEANNVEILGTELDAIEKAEDREKFKDLMLELGEPIPESTIVHTVEEALIFAKEIGYPVVVRPAFTLGGTGGGFAQSDEELMDITKHGLKLSPVTQCLIEKSIAGFKEIDSAEVDIEFLYFYLMRVREENNNQSVGAVFKNLKTEQIRKFLIPIPDLKTQKEAVNKIIEEMVIIRQNKRLIEIFEQKIKNKISEVWGE